MRPSLLLPLALVALLSACREPTSVTLLLTSDVACADHPATSVAVSRQNDEQLAPALVTQECQPSGTIGTLVVVPAADRDEDLRIRVVTRVGDAACEPPTYGPSCIVSRRQLRFIAHEELRVPVAQQIDCAGVACSATTTCRKGQCVDATIDQARCKANPDQCGSEFGPDASAGAGGAAGSAGAPGAGAGGVGGAGAGGAGASGAGASGAGAGGVSAGGAGMSGGSGQSGSGGSAGVSAGSSGASGSAGSAGQGGAGTSGSSGAGGASGGGGAGGGGAGGAGGGTGGGAVVPELPALPPATATGTTYYVRANGDDTRDGKSPANAWKTLDKVSATTFGNGDQVLFEGGAKFTGCLDLVAARVKTSTDAPLLIGSSSDVPFTIAASCTPASGAAVTLNAVSNVVLTDMILRGGQTLPYGVVVSGAVVGPSSGIRIQKSDISGFSSTNKSLRAAEILIGTSDIAGSGPLSNVMILNNVLHGLDGASSADENGVVVRGAQKNISTVLVQGNLIADLGGKPDGAENQSGNGVVIDSAANVTVAYNAVSRGGLARTSCGGPYGISVVSGAGVTVQFNEVSAMASKSDLLPTCGWGGYRLGADTAKSVVQYNYTHENRGPGFLASATGVDGAWAGNSFRFNISQNDGGGFSFVSDLSSANMNVFNNTLFTSGENSPMSLSLKSTIKLSGCIANNLLVTSSTAPALSLPSVVDVGSLIIRGNDYVSKGTSMIVWSGKPFPSAATWAEGTGYETVENTFVGLSTDPLLTKPGGGGTYGGYAPDLLAAYLLLPASKMRGTGRDLPKELKVDPGPIDYFGHKIPTVFGTGHNVGADGSAPTQ